MFRNDRRSLLLIPSVRLEHLKLTYSVVLPIKRKSNEELLFYACIA